jgi:hypothetical protein
VFPYSSRCAGHHLERPGLGIDPEAIPVLVVRPLAEPQLAGGSQRLAEYFVKMRLVDASRCRTPSRIRYREPAGFGLPAIWATAALAPLIAETVTHSSCPKATDTAYQCNAANMSGWIAIAPNRAAVQVRVLLHCQCRWNALSFDKRVRIAFALRTSTSS